MTKKKFSSLLIHSFQDFPRGSAFGIQPKAHHRGLEHKGREGVTDKTTDTPSCAPWGKDVPSSPSHL